MSAAQLELLEWLRNGRLVSVCIDSRVCGTRVYEPKWSYLPERTKHRITSRTVQALLDRGLIRVVRSDESGATYAIA